MGLMLKQGPGRVLDPLPLTAKGQGADFKIKFLIFFVFFYFFVFFCVESLEIFLPGIAPSD